jgi:hypothetical protein
MVAAGIGYTSFTTVQFALEKKPDTARDWNETRVYPLPYNRARYDAQVWRDRVQDAKMLVQLIAHGNEPHVLFYGFSADGEDSVNPQLIVSRLLLPLGYDVFSRRVSFFDHGFHMYFPFPVKPLADVRPTFAKLETPFFVHVHEPEHSASAVIAKYLNHATVTPVDLGLKTFTSYRVDAYAPPGPIPIQPLAEKAAATATNVLAGYGDGFCVTKWLQDAGEHSPLGHRQGTLSGHFDRVLREAVGGGTHYLNVTRRFATSAREVFDRSAVAYIVGWVDNPADHPVRATFEVVADDEVAVAVNDQSIIEALGWKSKVQYVERVLLPPGPSQVKIFYHKYWHRGGVAFAAAYEGGRPVAWKCDRNFR